MPRGPIGPDTRCGNPAVASRGPSRSRPAPLLALVGLAVAACTGGQSSSRDAGRADLGFDGVVLDSGTAVDAEQRDAAARVDGNEPTDGGDAVDSEVTLDAGPDATDGQDGGAGDAHVPDGEPSLDRDAEAPELGVLDAGPATDAAPLDATLDAGSPLDAAAEDAPSSEDAGDAGAGDAATPDGGAPSPALVVLAGGPGGMLAAEHGPQGWTVTALSDATDVRPALAAQGSGAVGLFRSTSGGALRYTTWSPGLFSAPQTVGTGVTTRAAPSGVGSPGGAAFVFHGDDFHHYLAQWAGTWSPSAEELVAGGIASFGPSPGAIAALGSDLIVAYAGNDGDLYDQRRSAGAWQAAHAHLAPAGPAVAPSLVALDAGSELLIVFLRSTDHRLVYTVSTGGAWSAPFELGANVFTDDSVSLLALPGGEALVAYRGQDSAMYLTRFVPTATPAWSEPAPIATPSPLITGIPALAPGTGAFEAELVYLEAGTGAAHHARLVGSTWTAPDLIGGSGLTGITATTIR